MIDKIYSLIKEDTNFIEKKDLNFKNIEFYYDVKPIYEFNVYPNIKELLKSITLKENSESFDIGKNDLKEIFKDNIFNKINLLTLDLKSFNEFDIKNIKFSNIAIILYPSKKDNALFFMGNIIQNFYKKLPSSMELHYGIVLEDSMFEDQIIEIIYS